MCAHDTENIAFVFRLGVFALGFSDGPGRRATECRAGALTLAFHCLDNAPWNQRMLVPIVNLTIFVTDIRPREQVCSGERYRPHESSEATSKPPVAGGQVVQEERWCWLWLWWLLCGVCLDSERHGTWRELTFATTSRTTLGNESSQHTPVGFRRD